MYKYDLIVITGPTASGKTTLAARLSAKLSGEVISADSRQVYRRMNIGTGKDLSEYIVNNVKVPVHLIDIVEPGYKYNVFEYQHDFLRAYRDIRSRGKFPVVCGGSGLYIDSIVSGYKLLKVPPDEQLRTELGEKSMEELIDVLKGYKKLHNITDIDTRKRIIRAIEIERYYKNNPVRSEMPKIETLVVGVKTDREVRRRKITARLKQRLEEGMLEEVKGLLDSNIDAETLIYYGLEYKYITLYLTGKISYDEMFSGLETAIHQFAKRQMTWFRSMERKGIGINWVDGEKPVNENVERILALV